jgi:enoyl-[acyl-carrier protein] reductase III
MEERKVAVVTGGSGEIGRAICLEFARRGYAIVFTYMRSYESARQLERELGDIGVPVLSAKAQLANAQDIATLFGDIEKEYGRIDCLVNNAASGVQRSAIDMTEKHWDWTHDVNVKAPWLCAVAASKLMWAGGSIVNISSLGSSRVLPYYVAVGTSKAALESLTRYLAVEFSTLNIRVNAVAGGVVKTGALNHFPNKDYMKKTSEERTPAGRLVNPGDIAKATWFLSSDDAWMIRGQVLVVDGGYSLVGM